MRKKTKINLNYFMMPVLKIKIAKTLRQTLISSFIGSEPPIDR